MIPPIINLNGSSRERLSEQYSKAKQAVHAAKDALRQIDVHPRDYPVRYPATRSAYDLARGQMNDAINTLHTIEEQLTTVLIDIMDQ